jgi:hypothetical protein
MRMGRTSAWRSAAAAAVLAGTLACAENITVPGVCPDYCPADSLTLVDTVLTGILVADTSVRGFNTVSSLGYLLAGDQDSLRTLSYLRYQSLPTRWVPGGTDTTSIAIGAIDSIIMQVRLDGRDTAVGNLRLLVYRAPFTLDTNTLNFDTLAQFAVDSLLLDSIAVPDSVGAGIIRQVVPVSAFAPDTTLDSNRIALVIDARGSAPTTVTMASTQVGLGPRLLFYVRGAPPNDSQTTVLQTVPDWDTFARTPEPPVGMTPGVRVGDAPAARAMLFIALPSYFLDSVTIVRAQLEMRLARPAAGRPGEGFLLRAMPVLRYFGGKSIIVGDTTTYGTAFLTAGDTGTVTFEIARPLRLWRGIPADSLPRVLMVRNRFEAFSLGAFEGIGSAGGSDAPRLRLTFIRPFRFGLP